MAPRMEAYLKQLKVGSRIFFYQIYFDLTTHYAGGDLENHGCSNSRLNTAP